VRKQGWHALRTGGHRPGPHYLENKSDILNLYPNQDAIRERWRRYDGFPISGIMMDFSGTANGAAALLSWETQASNPHGAGMALRPTLSSTISHDCSRGLSTLGRFSLLSIKDQRGSRRDPSPNRGDLSRLREQTRPARPFKLTSHYKVP
jgi:hypothetical protein